MLQRECIARRRRYARYALLTVAMLVIGGAQLLTEDHTPARVKLARLATRTIAGDRDLQRAPILDPWGTPYRLHHTAVGLAVVSAGPDRLEYTADDIRSY